MKSRDPNIRMVALLHRYENFLPFTDDTPIITLGEGGTPLLKSRSLCNQIGGVDLYFKLEGCNPTGSFKDRGMAVAISKVLESGSAGMVCASTGNTSASAAAYGAHFNIPTIVLIPAGGVSIAKLRQVMMYSPTIIEINGDFDRAMEFVRNLKDHNAITVVNSINKFRIEGQKTASFEIIDELGDAPEMVFIPVGNAGNITAYWKGFTQYYQMGISTKTPKMMGVQAEGSAPIVSGQIIKSPETFASAIRIGNPANWSSAINARDASGGGIYSVTDEDIKNAQILLASEEGIFCEPASAASFAGVVKMYEQGMRFVDSRIVCVITGTGLKDIDAVHDYFNLDILRVDSMDDLRGMAEDILSCKISTNQ